MRGIGRVLFATAASAGAVSGFGVTAAQAVDLNACTGSGRIYVNRAGPGSTLTNWSVEGGGSCPVQATPTAPLIAREPTLVQFAGAGTSDSLGLCDNTLLVQNFNLSVTATYVGAVTGRTFTEAQKWSAPVTTFPLATAFLITGDGGPPRIGAGVAFTHIFLKCGNDGNSPSANFVWTEIP
ncbi:MAG: hypothetical protein QOH62_314 [Solirubrobacteraceae bacterium]|jgi:hypothetical protein|nr:hypothetical protein [Solirubrobacteraceae bacterium]